MCDDDGPSAPSLLRPEMFLYTRFALTIWLLIVKNRLYIEDKTVDVLLVKANDGGQTKSEKSLYSKSQEGWFFTINF